MAVSTSVSLGRSVIDWRGRSEFCDAATAESNEAAKDLAWQAVRIFTLPLDEDPRNHQVFVQEFLLADDESAIDTTYAALAEGFAACEAEETDYGDGVVGRSIPPAAVGKPYEKEAHA